MIVLWIPSAQEKPQLMHLTLNWKHNELQLLPKSCVPMESVRLALVAKELMERDASQDQIQWTLLQHESDLSSFLSTQDLLQDMQTHASHWHTLCDYHLPLRLIPLSPTVFSPIDEALDAFSRGQFLIVVDDEDRENEGDLIIAAECMTASKMAFLIRHTSGVVCVPMTAQRLDDLMLPLMTSVNEESHQTAFTISVDLKHPLNTTGISAQDRTRTVLALADPLSEASDFARPGHLFPLRAKSGGILERAGHTEAAVDLCLLTGKQPVGVISELVKDDGSMARREDLVWFAQQHQIKMITIEALSDHVRKHHGQGR